MVSKFADNSTSLKQIDEELEEVFSSSSNGGSESSGDSLGEVVELDPANPVEAVDFEHSERGDVGLNQSSSNLENSR